MLPIAALLLPFLVACEEVPVTPGEPGTGILEVVASELEAKSIEGAPAPPVAFRVVNVGAARLTYVVEARDRRFTISPPVGTLDPGEADEIVLAYASRDLPAGTVGPLEVTVTVEGSRRRPARVAWTLVVISDPAKAKT
jgi:phage-related baseplate assembly protein